MRITYSKYADDLRNAVITSAADDFKKSLLLHIKVFGWRLGRSKYEKHKRAKDDFDYYADPFMKLYECERFFFDEYFEDLTKVDAEWLVSQLIKEVIEKAEKKNYLNKSHGGNYRGMCAEYRIKAHV